MPSRKFIFEKSGMEINAYTGDNLSKNTRALLTFKTGFFVVSGVALMENHKGELFLSFPSRKNRDGEYDDIVFPSSKEARKRLSEMAMKCYQEMKSAAECQQPPVKITESCHQPATAATANASKPVDQVGWINLAHNELPFS